MPLFKRKKKVNLDPKKIDESEIKQLVLYVTIINRGLANSIVKIFQNGGSSMQFIERGRGTAAKEIREILGIEDTDKDVVLSVVKQEGLEPIKTELLAFFAASKHNKGVGFAIPMSSTIGVRAYRFLADTL